ncbi:MAG: cation:proton antiporter [Bacteroidota bacterium]
MAGAALLIVLLGLVLRKLKQPYIVGYILIGILLGDAGFGVIQNNELIHHLGEMGIILLLFFVGMEINLPNFKNQWRVSLLGTNLQILLSVALMLGVGCWFSWSFGRSIVLGFVIALSSSAIVLRILEERKLTNTELGKNTLSILLTQDMLIAPLLIITSLVAGQSQSWSSIVLLLIGTFLFSGALAYIYTQRSVRLPFSRSIQNDHELQVFVALFFCFGGALLSIFFGLSAALGAFIGGMLINAAKATHWIHDTLNSFRVLFISIFFISVGLQIDFSFLVENGWPLAVVLLAVYLTNHVVNAVVLRLFSQSWKTAFLGGALLAQIGELSFLLIAHAYHLELIEEYSYLFTISLISITLLISPFWIALSEQLFISMEKLGKNS